MRSLPTVLADVLRIRQFAFLAHRPVFATAKIECDARGHSWLISREAETSFAIPLIGAGRHFDPAAREYWQSDHAQRLKYLDALTASQIEEELASLVSRFRFGPLSERMIWAIQLELLRHRQSTIEIPEEWLCAQIWSSDRPAHWRSELKELLASLSLLHVDDSESGDAIEFGDATAILTHFRVRCRGDHSGCHDGCRWKHRGQHGHVHINVGRGFLGCLERLTDANCGAAVRQYGLPTLTDNSRTRKAKERILKSIGKCGRLTSLFIPAKLGAPEVLRGFTNQQLRLIQELYRERVRCSKKDEESVSDCERLIGPLVPPIAPNLKGRPATPIPCPLLMPGVIYCGFNGNGVRKARGYLVKTWASKAGYDKPRRFLRDLELLSQRLGLTVVALAPQWEAPTGNWLDIEGLMALEMARPDVANRYHLRIYAADGFLQQWCDLFGWSDNEFNNPESSAAEQMLNLIAEHRLRRSEVADTMQIDRSVFSKMLNGKRRMPRELLSRFLDWLACRHDDHQSKDQTRRGSEDSE